MANKKITVVGDGADELLSPEEEHRIEEKIDAMLDVTLPDGTSPTTTEPQPAVAPPEVTAETPAPVSAPPAPEPAITEPKKVTKIVTRFADDEDDDVAPAPAEKAKPVEPVAVPEPEPKNLKIKRLKPKNRNPPKLRSQRPPAKKLRKPSLTLSLRKMICLPS
jgi:hypothetical protein